MKHLSGIAFRRNKVGGCFSNIKHQTPLTDWPQKNSDAHILVIQGQTNLLIYFLFKSNDPKNDSFFRMEITGNYRISHLPQQNSDFGWHGDWSAQAERPSMAPGLRVSNRCWSGRVKIVFCFLFEQLKRCHVFQHKFKQTKLKKHRRRRQQKAKFVFFNRWKKK